jgi:hypothetical protein
MISVLNQSVPSFRPSFRHVPSFRQFPLVASDLDLTGFDG